MIINGNKIKKKYFQHLGKGYCKSKHIRRGFNFVFCTVVLINENKSVTNLEHNYLKIQSCIFPLLLIRNLYKNVFTTYIGAHSPLILIRSRNIPMHIHTLFLNINNYRTA